LIQARELREDITLFKNIGNDNAVHTLLGNESTEGRQLEYLDLREGMEFHTISGLFSMNEFEKQF
jgi:hypothetical protein